MKQVFGIMSAMKRKMPYGIMNWAEVVRECYFVDSTAYIRALEDVKTPVFLRENVRTDVGWIRRLAGGAANALARVKDYVERGEGELVSPSGLTAKFDRAKFFLEDFFPYAFYYLGLLTFESPFRLGIPNLTVRNMFVDLLGQGDGRGYNLGDVK